MNASGAMDNDTDLQGFPLELPAEVRSDLHEGLALVAAGQAKQALTILQSVRERLHALDPGLGALAGSHLAEALVAAGQRSRAVQVLGEDAALVRAADYTDVRAKLLMQAAPLHPDTEFGLQLAAEADRLAATLDDPRPRVQTLEMLLHLLDRHGAVHAVLPVAEGLAVQGLNAGDQPAHVRGKLRVALWYRQQGRLDKALDEARSAHSAAAVLADPEHGPLVAEAAALRGSLARLRGEHLEALECLDQALLGQTTADETTWLQRTLAALALGVDPPRAQADLLALTSAADPSIAVQARRALALQHVDAGRLDEAAAQLAHLPADQRTAVQARLLVAQGRAAQAVPLLEQLAADAPEQLAVQLALAVALRKADRAFDALTLIDQQLTLALDGGDAWAELQLRLVRGPALADLGDYEACRQDARRAAEIAQQRHLPLHHATARTQVAYALARLDLPAEAVAELDQAATLAERVGAHATALQAALYAALVDTLAVREGLQGRPIDVLARLQTATGSGATGVVMLALARRAADVDGDVALAIELLNCAEIADSEGRLRNPIGQLRAALAGRGSAD